MSTKEVIYRKPSSPRLTDAEIDKLCETVLATESAVSTMKHEADLARYEAAWRALYESEVDWR